MSRFLPRLIASTLIVASAMAGAATSVQGAVSRIFPSGDDKIYFRLAGDTCNTGADYYYFSNTGTGSAQKSWFALLMLASGSGKPITVSIDNCDAGNKQIRYLFIEP